MAAKKESGKSSKKDASNETSNAADRVGAGAWRALVPIVGAAVAALGPALAVGGRALRERRDASERRRGLLVVPVVGSLLAVVGALAWRNRERVLEMAGEGIATAEQVAGELTGRLAGDGAPGEPDLASASFHGSAAPAPQGAPIA
jgi:hypothetical protein